MARIAEVFDRVRDQYRSPTSVPLESSERSYPSCSTTPDRLRHRARRAEEGFRSTCRRNVQKKIRAGVGANTSRYFYHTPTLVFELYNISIVWHQ